MVTKIDCDDVEICMITYNEEEFLEGTLMVLKDQFPRISILDNFSTDRTVEIARDIFGPRLKLLQRPRQILLSRGFSHVRNVVSDIASGPWLLHIDADEQLADELDGKIDLPRAVDDRPFFRIHRRNLLASPRPLRSECIPTILNTLECSSLEEHVRFYAKDPRMKWASFIHEEVWFDGRAAHAETEAAAMTINHLSAFRESRNETKEDLYAWMILRVYLNPPLRAGMRDFYYGDFVRNRIDDLLPRAERFASQNRLPL